MASTITIEKSYFDTLLRRARVHGNDQFEVKSFAPGMLAISQHQYDALNRTAREHFALQHALLQGGCTLDVISFLIHNALDEVDREQDVTQRNQFNPMAKSFQRTSQTTAFPSGFQKPYTNTLWQNDDWQQSIPQQVTHQKDLSFDDFKHSIGKPPVASTWVDGLTQASPPPLRPSPRNFDPVVEPSDLGSSGGEWQVCQGTVRVPSTKSTLDLKPIPGDATYREIVAIVRGGVLYDVHLQPREKRARVTFVNSNAAHSFSQYAKFEGVSIRGEKVDVSISDRPFKPAGNVNRHIELGATRNLVLRQVSPDIDERRIRDDLDHIHGLVVIDVSFSRGDVIVRLNAIYVALYARSCMKSRATYKKVPIEYYPDECDQPLPFFDTKGKEVPVTKKAPTRSQRLQSLNNRFDMLAMDEFEGESETLSAKSSSTHISQSSVDQGGVPVDA